MKDNEEYYGILLNDIVPRFDKINKFNKKTTSAQAQPCARTCA